MPNLTDKRAAELLERLVDYANDSHDEGVTRDELREMTVGELVEDLYASITDAPIPDEIANFWPEVYR